MPCVCVTEILKPGLDEGRLSINPRPPVERINGATVDVRPAINFVPSVVTRQRLSI